MLRYQEAGTYSTVYSPNTHLLAMATAEITEMGGGGCSKYQNTVNKTRREYSTLHRTVLGILFLKSKF